MNNSEKAIILMATYNGEKYIKNQINSIIHQTYTDWELYIRDDGSTDKTLDLLKEYEKECSRIHVISYGDNSKGACLNFYKLLRYAKEYLNSGDYFFLADQDDVWNSDKIEKTIQIAKNHKGKKPLLLYSDLLLMDEDGTCKNVKMSDIHDINLRNVNNIFFDQIYIWGNTICIDRRFLDYINIPDRIYNDLSHDHYLAFYGAAFGKIEYINNALIKYRRHTNNLSDLPAKYNAVSTILKILKNVRGIIDGHVLSYRNVLYFIDNAPYKTNVMKDVELAIKKGGFNALKIIRKYDITPGANRNNIMANKVILFLGIHKSRI